MSRSLSGRARMWLALLALASGLLAGPAALGIARSTASDDPAAHRRYREGRFVLSPADLVPAQAEATGTAAAIATFLTWNGEEHSESDVLRELGSEGVKPRSLDQAAEWFARSGFEGAWLESRVAGLYRLKAPFVAHLAEGGGRLAIVRAVRQGYLHLADPRSGNYVLTMEKFVEGWAGRVLAFEEPPASP